MIINMVLMDFIIINYFIKLLLFIILIKLHTLEEVINKFIIKFIPIIMVIIFIIFIIHLKQIIIWYKFNYLIIIYFIE